VAGLTTDEAEQAVREVVAMVIRNPAVSLTVVRATPLQPIAGEHLVSPDGKVTLGMYGQVHVAGLTLEQAKAAIDKHLAEYLDNPQVAVSVFAYNSKVYYVIVEGEKGDVVTRVVINGNETVLDALSQAQGLQGLSRKRIWIARPALSAEGGTDAILPVDWHAITRGAATTTNYQVLPGDRIFVVDEKSGRNPRY
jgi:protein involved in polysaccharide export with SLBB domain